MQQKQRFITSVFFEKVCQYMIDILQEYYKKMEHRPSNNSASEFIKKTAEDSFEPDDKGDQQPLHRYGGGHRVKTTHGFQRANWNLALTNKMSRSNRYYKGQEVSCNTHLDHFIPYGPGIYLFFKFLKQVTIIFLIMTLISIMPIVYNGVVGTRFTNVGSSIQVYMGYVTAGNQDASNVDDASTYTQHKLFNAIPDMVYSIIFFIFYLYWDYNSKALVDDIKATVKLPSYSTVQMTSFPKETDEQEIFEFMKNIASVKEVAVVKNYEEMIEISKEIFEMSLDLKEKKIIAESQGQELNEDDPEIIKDLAKIQELYSLLILEEQKRKDQAIRYYIKFQNPGSCQTALQTFQPYYRSCCFALCKQQIPQQLLLQGELPYIQQCHVQPGQIIWENVHVGKINRCARMFFQAFIVLLLLAITFFFICFLNILAPPLSNESINTSNYSESDIVSSNNATLIQTWCLNSYSSSSKADDIKTKCEPIIMGYYGKLVITVVISLIIIIARFFIRKIVILLARFIRYQNCTEQSKSVMTNLFIMYVVTTVLITVMMQASIWGISIKSWIGVVIPNKSYLGYNLSSLSQYNDFSGNWFLDIGYQVWLTWLIMALSPHVFWPLVHYFNEWNGQRKAKKQILQKNMEQLMESEEFDIQDHYANIMMVILVGYVFSSAIPLLLPLTFIGLITRYYYFKYSFVRFCRIPRTYDQSLNNRMMQLFPLTIVLHGIVSIWVYGVPQLFYSPSNWLSDIMEKSGAWETFRDIMIRLADTWYITFLTAFFLVVILFKTFFLDLVLKLIFFLAKDKIPSAMKEVDNSLIRSDRSLTQSYKLENNPDYFQIMAIMNPKHISQLRQTRKGVQH